DVVVVVVQSRQEVGHGLEGVGHGATEGAAVQVPVGSVQVDLHVGDPAHAHAHGRDVGRPHGGVGDDDSVAVQTVPVVAHEVGEVHRPGLLLPLDEHLDGDWRGVGAGNRQGGPHTQGVEEDLPLVVGGAARVQGGAAQGRGEGLGLPGLDGVDGLHVVVTVDQDGRCVGV